MRTIRLLPSSLRSFGWCVVLFLISTQSWGQETGCISGNCVNGYGTNTYTDGDQYVGEYKDGKRHGQGTYTWSDGQKYVGEYKDGKENGQGTHTWPDGQKQAGIWRNSEYLGTIAEIKRKKQAEAEAKAKRERAEAEAKRKYDKIYNACILDKSGDVDMGVATVVVAVKGSCEEIARDPSWLQKLKYE